MCLIVYEIDYRIINLKNTIKVVCKTRSKLASINFMDDLLQSTSNGILAL